MATITNLGVYTWKLMRKISRKCTSHIGQQLEQNSFK